MAHKYYNSASGGASSPYESAATAGTALATVLAAIGASDEIIWVDDASAEAAAGGTFTASATYATPQKPQRLYGVSDFDASPSTLASGAKLTQTASGVDWAFEGNWDIRCFDLDLSTGTAAGQLTFGTTASSSNFIYTNGTISFCSGTSTLNGLQLGPPGSTTVDQYRFYLDSVTFSFAATANKMLRMGQGYKLLKNIVLSGPATPTDLLLGLDASTGDIIIADSDLTGKSWTSLVDSASLGQHSIKLINCKIPSDVTIYAGTSPFIVVELIKTGNADVGYGYAKYRGGVGSIITDASVYATTDPMQDGGVSISNLFASASTCNRGFPLSRTYIIPCVADTAVTPFVEILVQGDGASALNTDEIYITASTITVDGTTKGTTVTSHPGAITAGSACSAGTTAYTGDGYTTERTHRIETAAITPRQSGYIEIEVCLVKPSTAIYIGQVGAA